ncbi:hypothetical protein ILYODFUR_001263 [Ilyodon furcidens]|uniref:Uncharacterized protein n=1 Tax=Ilyodon furcidens TaxID=33524 RepID=A0ABV0SVY7_9TELE
MLLCRCAAITRRSCLNSRTERELETPLQLQLPSYSCCSSSSSRTTSLSHHIQSSFGDVTIRKRLVTLSCLCIDTTT